MWTRPNVDPVQCGPGPMWTPMRDKFNVDPLTVLPKTLIIALEKDVCSLIKVKCMYILIHES